MGILLEEIVKEICKQDPDHVKPFYLRKNYGQHNALKFGITRISGDFAVTMDEDLQHDPKDIDKLAEKQREGDFDLVYGVFPEPRTKGIRVWLSKFLRIALTKLIPGLYWNYSPFRLIRKEICRLAGAQSSSFVFLDDYLNRVARTIEEVQITHYPRLEGRSSYSFFRIVRLGFFLFLAYSGMVKWSIAGGFILLGSTLIVYLYSMLSPDGSLFFFLVGGITNSLFVSGLILTIAGLSGCMINSFRRRRLTRNVDLK